MSIDALRELAKGWEPCEYHPGEWHPEREYCPTCEAYVLARALLAALDENERLRDALVQVDRHVCMNRMWGGMEWDYHQMPAFRVEKIAGIAADALARFKEVSDA